MTRRLSLRCCRKRGGRAAGGALHTPAAWQRRVRWRLFIARVRQLRRRSYSAYTRKTDSALSRRTRRYLKMQIFLTGRLAAYFRDAVFSAACSAECINSSLFFYRPPCGVWCVFKIKKLLCQPCPGGNRRAAETVYLHCGQCGVASLPSCSSRKELAEHAFTAAPGFCACLA